MLRAVPTGTRLILSILVGTLHSGCTGSVGGAPEGDLGAGDGSTSYDMPDLSGTAPDPDAGGPGPDTGVEPPPDPPTAHTPCEVGRCWDAPALSSFCGANAVDEDFSSGKYNVHAYPLHLPAGVAVALTLDVTGGSWKPALLVHDAQGTTLHDGERSLSKPALTVKLIASGRGGGSAGVRLEASSDRQVSVFVTAWSVVDGGFAPATATTAKYQLGVLGDCPPPPPGSLLSPPNFDPADKVNGYYLLPDSSPPGLYTRKADDCSRGNRLLIDVLYTVAHRFKQIRPDLAPIAIRDLNEGSCSTVNHSTHDDGTHADVVAGCATQVSCTDNQPAIDLAKLFVDTGAVCGIINNDAAVQTVINAYFASRFSYTPWHGTFMRSVDGHTSHFHIRVKKPDGSCN